MPRRTEPQPALGAALRTLRTKAGITQEEVARRADMHPTWVTRIELGQANPSWGTVTRVARALNASMVDVATAEQALLQD